jgi:hypothetical protein
MFLASTMVNDNDSDDVPDNTPNSAYTIYVPTFLDDVLLSQILITDLTLNF